MRQRRRHSRIDQLTPELREVIRYRVDRSIRNRSLAGSFLYSGLLLWLNCTSFRGIMRPHPVRIAALLCSLLFFGYFSVLTILDRLGLLSS